FFFFSSRRRHTRFSRDWSSDVCSSDLNQVEELKRLNQHFVRRAAQLADLHRAVQDITSELGVQAMLEQLLPSLARALGTTQLTVDITETDVHVAVAGTPSADRPRSVLTGSG